MKEIDKFIKIVDKEKVSEIIPFLKSLNLKERQALSLTIKNKIEELKVEKEKNKDTKSQFLILSVASFLCFNLKDYKHYYHEFPGYFEVNLIRYHKYTQESLMEGDLSLDSILEWYCPSWLEECFSTRRNLVTYTSTKYTELMRWYDKGYIRKLVPEVVAETLSHIPFSYKYDDNWKGVGQYNPNVVLEHPLCLKEHIWYLFEIPTNICYQELYMQNNENWAYLLKMLINEKYLNIHNVLQNTLKALVNTQFDKNKINWFADLFTFINPQKEQLLLLQTDLIVALQASQSKAVNTVLNAIKLICTHDDFIHEEFRCLIPTLITSSIKATIKISIDIIASLLEHKPDLINNLCEDLCYGLVINDELLQKRIIKLLVKYGDPAILSESINDYSSSIILSNHGLLEGFLQFDFNEDTKAELPIIEVQEKPINLNPNNRINTLESFEDILFFALSVFKNKDACNYALLPFYLQKIYPIINTDQINQLEPLFKQADEVINKWSNNIGFIDRILASFILSYGKLLLKKQEVENERIKEYTSKNKEIFMEDYWFHTLKPNFFLYSKIIESLKMKRKFELLSTPTHSPLWIDPLVLVNRLQGYCDGNLLPYSIDLEMAINRCCLEDTRKALEATHKTLCGELKELMIFLFDQNITLVNCTPIHKNWWITAYMNKYPNQNIDNRLINNFPNEYFTEKLNWELTKVANYTNDKLHYRTIYPILETNDVKLKDADLHFINEYIYIKAEIYHRFWDGDVSYLIYNTPRNHGVLLYNCLDFINTYDKLNASAQKALYYSLEALYQLNLVFSSTDHLFLAFTFFSPDKTIKDFASELWIQSVQYKNVDNTQLGQALASIINKNWLSLTRLNTLLEGMLDISNLHNQAMEEMIFASIVKLKEIPKNFKKLLDIYYLILVKNQSSLQSPLKEQIVEWKQNKTLKKICEKLLSI